MPARGSYRLRGKDVATDRSALRDIAFGHEGDRALLMRCSGRENVELYLARNDVRHKRATIDRAAEQFGLAHWLDKETHLYSKGMRQKLCLLGPLLVPARVVLLDEPTVGLDAESLGILADMLRVLREPKAGPSSSRPTRSTSPAQSSPTSSCWPAGRVLADLDDRAFRAVIGGRRFVVTVRDAAIPALAGWASAARRVRRDRSLARRSRAGADLDDALLHLLHAGIIPTSVSTGEPSFDVVYQRILSDAQPDRDLDQVPFRSLSPRAVAAVL